MDSVLVIHKSSGPRLFHPPLPSVLSIHVLRFQMTESKPFLLFEKVKMLSSRQRDYNRSILEVNAITTTQPRPHLLVTKVKFLPTLLS